MTLSPEQIAEIEGLVAKATKGPWRGYSEPDVNLPYSLFSGTPMETGFAPIEPLAPCDIDLIVALKNSAPSLILAAKGCDRLKAENERLREAVLEVVNATRAYLPPDGIDAQECINRVLAATDNPTINPIILEVENDRT